MKDHVKTNPCSHYPYRPSGSDSIACHVLGAILLYQIKSLKTKEICLYLNIQRCNLVGLAAAHHTLQKTVQPPRSETFQWAFRFVLHIQGSTWARLDKKRLTLQARKLQLKKAKNSILPELNCSREGSKAIKSIICMSFFLRKLFWNYLWPIFIQLSEFFFICRGLLVNIAFFYCQTWPNMGFLYIIAKYINCKWF